MESFFHKAALESYRNQVNSGHPLPHSVGYRVSDIDLDEQLVTWVITGQNSKPRIPLSLNIDETTFDKIRLDAEALGIEEEDLVCWLLEKYARGELIPAYFANV